jgi:energy-coupling factor transporter ATP-binding protein EcfA2
MKIINLKAENIKKLVAIDITPTGHVVKITGKNGQGKTSILDSIFWALGGTENIQAQPIRQGEKKARVELDLGDMIVTRTFTEGGSALTITNKEGLKFPSPQTMLDNLLGRLAFDPLEFMSMDPKKQLETLRALTGVDVSDLDKKRQSIVMPSLSSPGSMLSLSRPVRQITRHHPQS